MYMSYIFETDIFKARVLQGIWPARPGRGSFDQFQRNSFLIVFCREIQHRAEFGPWGHKLGYCVTALAFGI